MDVEAIFGHIIVHQTCSWNLGFGSFICVSKSDKEGKGQHMLVTNHVVNIVNRINICDIMEKQTCTNRRVESLFHLIQFVSICFTNKSLFSKHLMSGTDLPYLLARHYSLSITRLSCSAIFSNCDICRHFKFCWTIVNSSITTTKGIYHHTKWWYHTQWNHKWCLNWRPSCLLLFHFFQFL